MNVIFPLVFLTAVLNSYKTLKAPRLLPDGSLSQGYLRESLERASPPATKNSCFLSYTAPLPPELHLQPSVSLLFDAYVDFSWGEPPPPAWTSFIKS